MNSQVSNIVHDLLLKVNNPTQGVDKQSDPNPFANPWSNDWMDLGKQYAKGALDLFNYYTTLGKKQAAHWTDFGQEEVEFWNGHKYTLNSKG